MPTKTSRLTADPVAISGGFFPLKTEGRRVVVLDSATHSYQHVQANGPSGRSEVVVNASYAGVYCARLVEEAEPLGVVGIDCGIGKDGAGIAGLWFFEALGVPAVAADVTGVELGNGRDLWESGIVSRANHVAEALGVRPGRTTVAEAAQLILGAPAEIPAADPYQREIVAGGPAGRSVVVTNSIADALPEDRGVNVLCTAGHTGRSVVDYVIRFAPYGFICSDGAVGKNNSGLSALAPADEAGIPGAAVSAYTARMGDGHSTYYDGVISAANALAARAGVTVGMPAAEAAQLLVGFDGA